MILVRTVLISLFSLSLFGCVSPYQPFGFGGGYKETEIELGKYQLYFGGNGFADADLVDKYWHRRAGELCPNGYDHKITKTGIVESYGGYPGLTVDNPEQEGIITCKNIDSDT